MQLCTCRSALINIEVKFRKLTKQSVGRIFLGSDMKLHGPGVTDLFSSLTVFGKFGKGGKDNADRERCQGFICGYKRPVAGSGLSEFRITMR